MEVKLSAGRGPAGRNYKLWLKALARYTTGWRCRSRLSLTEFTIKTLTKQSLQQMLLGKVVTCLQKTEIGSMFITLY
jgi:hypothetical protein